MKPWASGRTDTVMMLPAMILPGLLVSLGIGSLSTAGVERWLPPAGAVQLHGAHFAIAHGHNAGFTPGTYGGSDPWPLVVVVAGILTIALMAVIMVEHGLPVSASWPFGLILGGALANLVDRAVEGQVTDFLVASFDGVHGAMFNLGDVSAALGMILLLATIFQEACSRAIRERLTQP